MELTEQGLMQRQSWEAAGYCLPRFDRKAMRKATRERPFWIHFGAGNLFRAFQANAVQKLLNTGDLDRGLIVAEGYDYEIIEKTSRPHDDYSILVTLKADGGIDKTVIGSVAESLALDFCDSSSFGRLKEIFSKDSLQIASFTITEKGYLLKDGNKKTLPDIQKDFEAGPKAPQSYLGKIAALLYARFLSGKKPLALVSMDNCSHNGDRLYLAIRAFAGHWTKSGKADAGFLPYINDANTVSFPWTMIDKITPRPDASVEAILKKDKIKGLAPVVTSKKTYVAPFVNAEECEYLVIEDDFPNGRPALEKAGFLFADRQTVERAEKMKVCTCLNPLHTALAVFGCLLGYKRISEEMKDPALKNLVEGIGYAEGLPVVSDPKILNPEEFLDAAINVRFPNPFMPDSPQRIATDTSQKLAVRFGKTICAYADSDRLDVSSLKKIPLVFAGWLRYLTGIDDCGKAFELSPDPLLDALRPCVASLKPGQPANEEALRPILSNSEIFGANLYETGLAERVCGYLGEMLAGPGAVRATLEKYCG